MPKEPKWKSMTPKKQVQYWINQTAKAEQFAYSFRRQLMESRKVFQERIEPMVRRTFRMEIERLQSLEKSGKLRCGGDARTLSQLAIMVLADEIKRFAGIDLARIKAQELKHGKQPTQQPLPADTDSAGPPISVGSLPL